MPNSDPPEKLVSPTDKKVKNQPKQVQQQQIPSSAASSQGTLADPILSLKINQKCLERGLQELRNDSKKQQEINNEQFGNITATLQQIMAKLDSSDSSAGATGSSNQQHNSVVNSQTSLESTPIINQPSAAVAEDVFQNHDRDQSTLFGNIHQHSRKLHDLPTFSGAPEDWPKFYSMYIQSTAAYGYSELDNSIRLQRCLSGDAKEAVDCLLLNVGATTDVIEALEFRFGRPELLAQSQLQRVREIQPISEAKVELILPFASKVANMVAYLDRPKTKQYLLNPELLEQLIQKLPLSKRHDWGRYAINIQPCPTVQHFSEWLKELAKCVSFMMPAASLSNLLVNNTSSTHNNVRSQQQPPHHRDRTFVTENVHRNIYCVICKEDTHNILKCKRFLDLNINDRWNIVRSKRLCFSCLRPGHGTNNCHEKGGVV